MNCKTYQDLLSDFIDGSLAPEDHNSVAGHLSVCGDCADARNDLGAPILASPAVAAGRLYLRIADELVCIGSK